MHDDIGTGHQLIDQFVVADGAGNELESVRIEAVERGGVARVRQRVQDGDRVVGAGAAIEKPAIFVPLVLEATACGCDRNTEA